MIALDYTGNERWLDRRGLYLLFGVVLSSFRWLWVSPVARDAAITNIPDLLASFTCGS